MTRIGETLAFHLSLIGDLAEDDREAISALDGDVRELRRQHDILTQGDAGTHAVIVLTGFLQRYSMAPEGRRQIHSFYLPTDAPCLETLYIDYVDSNVGAAVDSMIGLIPNAKLYALIAAREGVRKLLWRETLVQAAVFREWLMRNSKMTALESMAHFFCEMFVRAKAAGIATDNGLDLPITQEALADALGLTPVHTNRTLMLLREDSSVDWRGGRLDIKDWKKLSQIAGFDRQYLHLRRSE